MTKNGTILASKNLKHFQDLLEDDGFIRTHQSYLVNKLEIDSIKSNTVILKNEAEIPVSVRRKSKIVSMLNA